MEFKPQESESVYLALASHQINEVTWELASLVKELQVWTERFNIEFKLSLPVIAMRVDWVTRHCYGYFRQGHNGFGLLFEVTINRHYIGERQAWETLGTLLHEMLHVWQEVFGRPGKNNYHNKQFRDKAESLGLIIDKRGFTQYEPQSPFFNLLARFDVELPEIREPATRSSRTKGSSKLKKWVCGCSPPVNVRVGIKTFKAVCLICNCKFTAAR